MNILKAKNIVWKGRRLTKNLNMNQMEVMRIIELVRY